jgi:hypothetical protein
MLEETFGASTRGADLELVDLNIVVADAEEMASARVANIERAGDVIRARP